MNAKSIALIITFAAVAIALNIVRIPAIYLPNMPYYFSDIPIVVAFLLFGPKIGVLVEVLHLAGQLVLFPAGYAGFVIYPMGFVAALIMLAGVYVASRFIARKAVSNNPLDLTKSMIYLTGFAVAFRGAFMPLIDYVLTYRVLLPLAMCISIPEIYIATLVPSLVLFNVTVPLYTIPIAYVVATRVGKYLKIEPRLLKHILSVHY